MKIKNKVSAKLLGSAMLSSVILLGSCQKEQELVPDTQPAVSEVNLKDSLTELAVATSVPDGFYDLTKALPSGYVKDGSKDYTAYIQKAIDSYSKVAFPGFPLMVNDSGLKIPSNRYLSFLKGSELRLKPTSKGNYDIIRIENASNVTLANPVVRGDRYKHTGTSGEWGHGIGIYGSYNVNVSGAKVYDCWGDGIYVARTKSANSRKIRLFMVKTENNRRDGISVISVEGLEMYRPYAANSNGTSPYCGINIEPDSYTDELKDINIVKPVTENNKGNGIQIGLTNLYGYKSKEVSISITDHVDIGSGRGLKTACRTSKRSGSETVSGTLYLSNPNWQKNTTDPLYAYSADQNWKMSITNPKIMSTSGSYFSDSQVKSILEGSRIIWAPTVYSLSL